MMTDHFWVSIVMAIGFVLISKAVGHIFRSRRVPRNFDDWQDELESVACEAVRASIHAADAQRRLVEMIGELPKDFDPVIWDRRPANPRTSLRRRRRSRKIFRTCSSSTTVGCSLGRFVVMPESEHEPVPSDPG